jgi:hypothetical protein
MKSKVNDVYDKYYDETFTQILHQGYDREAAKELIGKIFKDTITEINELKNRGTEVSKTVFERNKQKYGLY